jgi:hypothetical protein
MINKKYFVSAICRTKKKNSTKIHENYHNGIIKVPFFIRKDHTLINRLTIAFANKIQVDNTDLEIKELIILSLNKV